MGVDQLVTGGDVNDPVVDSLITGSGTIDGTKEIPGVPSSSSDVQPTFGIWQQPSSDRPVFLEVEVSVQTDGTDRGLITFEADESGGTTKDYGLTFAEATEELGGGATILEYSSVVLPAGAQYRIANNSDPNNANTIENVRIFVL